MKGIATRSDLQKQARSFFFLVPESDIFAKAFFFLVPNAKNYEEIFAIAFFRFAKAFFSTDPFYE